jgi:hypothetical protein
MPRSQRTKNHPDSFARTRYPLVRLVALAAVVLSTSCESAHPEIVVDSRYRGPVVIVYDTPDGTEVGAPIIVPPSGTVFLRKEYDAHVRVLNRSPSGGVVEEFPLKTTTTVSTDCGEYWSWAYVKGGPTDVSARAPLIRKANVPARAEWERRRAAAGLCSSQTDSDKFHPWPPSSRDG